MISICPWCGQDCHPAQYNPATNQCTEDDYGIGIGEDMPGLHPRCWKAFMLAAIEVVKERQRETSIPLTEDQDRRVTDEVQRRLGGGKPEEEGPE